MSRLNGLRLLLPAAMLPLVIGGCMRTTVPDAELDAAVDCIMHADTAAPLYPLRWSHAPYASYCGGVVADVDARVAARRVVMAGRALP